MSAPRWHDCSAAVVSGINNNDKVIGKIVIIAFFINKHIEGFGLVQITKSRVKIMFIREKKSNNGAFGRN